MPLGNRAAGHACARLPVAPPGMPKCDGERSGAVGQILTPLVPARSNSSRRSCSLRACPRPAPQARPLSRSLPLSRHPARTASVRAALLSRREQLFDCGAAVALAKRASIHRYRRKRPSLPLGQTVHIMIDLARAVFRKERQIFRRDMLHVFTMTSQIGLRLEPDSRSRSNTRRAYCSADKPWVRALAGRAAVFSSGSSIVSAARNPAAGPTTKWPPAGKPYCSGNPLAPSARVNARYLAVCH
jgi:hypothetical protein